MVSDELKQLRLQLGFSQEEAARILKISRRTYQNYEYANESNETKNIKICTQKFQRMKTINRTCGILTLKDIVKKTANVFKKYPLVECAYLFGSYARKEASEKSDVDIMVIAPEASYLELGGLQIDISQALLKDVDIVTLSQISDNVLFLSEILTKGVKIYGKVPIKGKN